MSWIASYYVPCLTDYQLVKIIKKFFLNILKLTHKERTNLKSLVCSVMNEIFKVESNATISSMYKFSNILSHFKSLHKIYATNELLNNILRSLPKSWKTRGNGDKKIPTRWAHRIPHNLWKCGRKRKRR